MRVAVAGSSGLIGSALVDSLRRDGHEVLRLVRSEPTGNDQLRWDPVGSGVPAGALTGYDAVVGLGGVGISDSRWSGEFRQRLRDSRIPPAEVLGEAATRDGVPRFLSGSATGFYGDTGDRQAVETDPPGPGFLADLVVDWEQAAIRGAGPDTRVILLRTAPVLSPHGGMLGKLRPLFKLGLGGRIGSGHQWFSWISLEDEIRAIKFLLTADVRGPVNLAAPQPVSFRNFTHTIGEVLHRPTFAAVSAFLARRVGGEMAEEMILASQRVVPSALDQAGFRFSHPQLRAALEYALA